MCAAGGTRCAKGFRVKVCTHHIYLIKPYKLSESAPNPCQIVFSEKLVSQIAQRHGQIEPPPHHRFSGSEIFSRQGVGKCATPLEIIVRSYKESIKPQKLNQSVPKLCFTYFFENLICCGIYACPSADSPQCGFLRNVSIPN